MAGERTDAVGVGTYAASVLLQLDPQARITSLSAYAGRSFNAWSANNALSWAAANARDLDVVLLAFPPGELLDPISAAMKAGEWDEVSDALSRYRLDGRHGPVYGAPLDYSLQLRRTRDASAHDRGLLWRYYYNTAYWESVRQRIRSLTEAGVAVVAPAGDVGPGVQTILGVANLPEVVTVGGFDGGGVSTHSASGPSIDGKVKPDLIAPTGMVGLLPQRSVMAGALGPKGLLDRALEPAWELGAPATNARTRLDTTITSAAYVAASMGGMSAEGLREVARQRGALTAAAVPVEHTPVWRQGAGVLRLAPSASFATSRPLVLDHGDLGAEPASGDWSASLRVVQGSADGASTDIRDFAGVAPDATTTTSTVSSSPPVGVRVTEDGVDIALPLGNDSYRAGLYCGYTHVGIPGTGGEADPSVRAHGLPEGAEQVPTCFVEGSRLRAFGFYIHDLPAENLTFGLLPAMPPGASLLHKPLTMIPIDPLSTKIFFKVTGDDGNAYFPNVPPGYYTIRQWSDYGSPVTETFADSVTGLPAPVDSDVGEKVAYESFQALVLTPLCTDQVSDATGASPCTMEFLTSMFGQDNVAFDPVTWTYVVSPAPGVSIRIVFERLKKMPGPAVSSRYVDLLAYQDFKLLTSRLPTDLKVETLEGLTGVSLQRSWGFTPAPKEGLAATYNPVQALRGDHQVGIAYYPFNLTTPNYKAHMALDFEYSIRNAVIVVVVQTGDDFGIAFVTPDGSVRASGAGSLNGLLRNLRLSGSSDGKAHFDFNLLPRGASQGKVWMLFVPPVNTLLASAEVREVSFELDTWVNDLWPPVTFADPAELVGTNPQKPGVVAGHSFRVSSNYSASQMSHDGCRDRVAGMRRAAVCEDWVVMVHSPGDDAATYDVADAGTGESLKPTVQASGAGFFDPRRGVHDFTHVLGFNGPSVPVLEANVRVTNAFRTNGRFWEQLALTKAFNAVHPGPVELRIVDNLPGRTSVHLGVPHHNGGVPVAPYVPFAVQSLFLDL